MAYEKKNISQDMLDLLYLISCAMHEVKADVHISAGFDLKKIFVTSAEQSLVYVTYLGVDESAPELKSSEEVLQKWDKYSKQTLRKNLLLDIEREKLAEYLESNGIWYMPLKGVILQGLYPVYGMRQMMDNDILFDASRREDVHTYMESNGFKTEQYCECHHDVYTKPPLIEFEMHTELFGSKNNPQWRDYYSNVKDRLVLEEGTSYKYRFTDEDFYIYQIMHAYKHYRLGGSGLRHLLDTYVFLSAKNDTLNRDYVLAELDKLGAKEYALLTEELCYKLFSAPRHFTSDEINSMLSSDEMDMLYVMGLAGTYGTQESSVETELKKSSGKKKNGGNRKLNYYLSRAFPDDDWWRRKAPFCYRHPWAKPFYNFYRLIRGITVRRKKLAREIELVNKEIKEGE